MVTSEGLHARRRTTDYHTRGSQNDHSSRALRVSSDFGPRVSSYFILLLFTAVIPRLSSRIRLAQANMIMCEVQYNTYTWSREYDSPCRKKIAESNNGLNNSQLRTTPLTKQKNRQANRLKSNASVQSYPGHLEIFH